MPGISEKNTRYAAGLAFAGLTAYLGYLARRSDFVPFITVYGTFFGLYAWLLVFRRNELQANARWYLGIGIALRILLLFSIPNLSDDFYRFLWDGRLTVAGFHPFAHPPVYFIENQIFPKGITPDLYSKLNSPQYFTVYPPVCQAVFALAAWFSPANDWGGAVVMKLFLLACELGSVWLLGIQDSGLREKCPPNPNSLIPNPQLLYALNPLIIFEIAGNCHFEGAMIFFLLAGWRALERQKVKQAAVWWALATASKLLPVMLVPIVWRWLGWRKGLIFSAVFGVVCLVLFAPLLSVLPNILSSLDLYFRQFQFNASVYYVLRGLGFWIKGYDIGESLGPFLGVAAATGVLIIAARTTPHRLAKPAKRKGLLLSDALIFALMLHLSLSAAVHPWYVTVPFAMSLFTKWRFPLAWTGLVALSYSHYAGDMFQENYWLIALEYGILWLFILRESTASRRQS